VNIDTTTTTSTTTTIPTPTCDQKCAGYTHKECSNDGNTYGIGEGYGCANGNCYYNIDVFTDTQCSGDEPYCRCWEVDYDCENSCTGNGCIETQWYAHSICVDTPYHGWQCLGEFLPYPAEDECSTDADCQPYPGNCNNECRSQSYDSGYCDEVQVYLGSPSLCESGGTCIGNTEDCYVPSGTVGIMRGCCCESETGFENNCYNGIDDDSDGLIDCLDSDCAYEQSCQWPNVDFCEGEVDYISDTCEDRDLSHDCLPSTNLDNCPVGTQRWETVQCRWYDGYCGTEYPTTWHCKWYSFCKTDFENDCFDAIDNDNDGYIDQDDPDCCEVCISNPNWEFGGQFEGGGYCSFPTSPLKWENLLIQDKYCCGDDSNEYYKCNPYTRSLEDYSWIDDCVCCDNENDVVINEECVEAGTCNQECISHGYGSGYCDVAGVRPGEYLCESGETNIGWTEDCYVRSGILEINRGCCCSDVEPTNSISKIPSNFKQIYQPRIPNFFSWITNIIRIIF